MDFIPDTLICFSRTGIDDLNKVVCEKEADLLGICAIQSKLVGYMTKTSFQRADGYFTVRVDHTDIPYYKLLQADTLVYKNEDVEAAFYIFCNIVSVEWKNPDCSFVKFKIDQFMTYQFMIAWDKTYAFIEREHVKEDWASKDGNPLFSNMGPSEDFNLKPDTPFYTWTKGFAPERVLVQSPYNSSAKPTFAGSLKGHLYNSLNSVSMPPAEASEFFTKVAETKEASINNIVGVYGIPEEWYNTVFTSGDAYGGDQSEDIPAVNVAGRAFPSGPITFHNAKCWSSEFVTIRLMSSEGQTIDFNPQWFGNNQDNYTVRYRAHGAGGMFGSCQCTLENKNGTFNWDAWNDFIVALTELPACPWTGDGFTNWAKVNKTATEFNAFLSMFSHINSAFTQAIGVGENVVAGTGSLSGNVGGALGAVESYASAIGTGLNLIAKINQQKSSGATVHGAGHFSALTDVATGAWGFKIIYYGVQQYLMQSVDSYFDRFGYRVNKLKKLELKNRPLWTFLKTQDCHVVAKPGLPFNAQKIINEMFNHGVTMWTLDYYSGLNELGDYSRADQNLGVKG